MKNTLKEKLQHHQQPIGTFFELGSPNAAEALGHTGLDFIIIDNESWAASAPWRGYGRSVALPC